MMKKAAIFAAAIALVLSLAACGNRDGKNDGSNSNTGGTNNNSTLGTAGNNGSTGSGGVTNNGGGTAGDSGLGTGSNSGTGTTDNTRMGGNATRSAGSNTANNAGRSIGGDVRGAVDDMGHAVDDLLDIGNNSRAAGMTSFERMLENARVHDVDGVLTDGENTRW